MGNRTRRNLKLRCVKTTLCQKFIEQRCPHTSDKCRFAHGNHELRAKPKLQFTKMCTFVEEGKLCKRGDACPFAHRPEQIVPLPPNPQLIPSQELAAHTQLAQLGDVREDQSKQNNMDCNTNENTNESMDESIDKATLRGWPHSWEVPIWPSMSDDELMLTQEASRWLLVLTVLQALGCTVQDWAAATRREGLCYHD